MKRIVIVWQVLMTTGLLSVASETIRLGSVPAPLPNGKQFVFEWDNDIWRASCKGGAARQLTRHPAKDIWPCVSADGKWLAFASNRDNTTQVYIMPINGGDPRQITFHTEGATPICWFPDGKSILIRATRDQVRVGEQSSRFFRVPVDGSGTETLLFDAYGKDADISPDGKKILFTRDGVQLYRKGYRGSLASKIWLYDIETGVFRLMCDEPSGARSPMWRPDGKGFYYVSQKSGCFNVWDKDLKSGRLQQLTHFKKDAVIMPRLSRNGHAMVFRKLFDFYCFDPTAPQKPPARIKLACTRDRIHEKVRRRWYTNIYNNSGEGSLDWTDDGLQMCFTTGGDLWVMDTVLREPLAVTKESGIHDTEAVFSKDNKSIVFLRDFGDRVNIWRAEKGDPDDFWWHQKSFVLTAMTDDDTAKYNLSFSPDGKKLAYCVPPGRIMVADADGSNPRQIAQSEFEAYYDWSPDSRRMVCTLSDADGNRDVWIVSVDGQEKPYNLSRSPKWDGGAVWSPDGRKIAFVGRRHDNTVKIFYVYLQDRDEHLSNWNLKLEKAIKTMHRKRAGSQKNTGESKEADNGLKIDFEGLSDRLHSVDVSSTSGNLFWSFDSKALVFQANIGGKSGTWKIVFPDHLRPEYMTATNGTQGRWIKNGNKILWCVNMLPTAYTTTYSFSAYQETDIEDYRRLAFRQIWRYERDRFYDSAHNNLDWDAILRKYEDMAAESPNLDIFNRTATMLLGELNASHLWFAETATSRKEWRNPWSAKGWNIRTGHTGLLFDRHDKGPGLLVKHVIETSPASQNISRIYPGERVTRINDEPVSQNMAWYRLLTGRYPREDRLTVMGTNGVERTVLLRTISYGEARDLIREESIKALNRKVNRLSGEQLGYLHIAKMQWEDLYRFEQEVFARGFGKDGLVIDVRSNPGGFVADRLLDILCHPVHAYTVPRDGTVGYPLGYLGKAVWNKPIVVLCNQYTGSNGEIFCHAIKTLKRGKLVGVPTQGAVISMPTVNILDMGQLSVPDRGWFVSDTGRDMELNGARPDVNVPLSPADVDADRDPQLKKAISVLLSDIQEARKHPPPPLVKASVLRARRETH